MAMLPDHRLFCSRSSSCWLLPRLLGPALGFRHSWSGTVIFGSFFLLWCSSACTLLQSASAAVSCLSNGGSFTLSIPWWVSLMDSVGQSWEGKTISTGRDSFSPWLWYSSLPPPVFIIFAERIIHSRT